MLSLAENDLYSLLLDLVAIPSVSFSEEENRAADFIFSTLSDLEYFRRNPSFLRFLPAEGDPLGRKAVAALVKANPRTKKTVIITGHFDVVDAEACGHLKNLAFSPEEYTRRVDELEIPEEARDDLASGEYLFGRRVSDMKSGIALEMCLIGALSRLESFPANVLFLAVPDEENTSAGMRGAVPWLVRLRDEWELEYAACLNSEPSVGGRGIPAGGVYVGTIGKIMPFYLCVGKEAHVGDYYEGVSASLLTSYLSLILEGSPETAESLDGVHFPPQACLRFKDLVKNYSVTLPERSVAYYNCLTVSRTPARILEEMKTVAGRALEMTLTHLSKARQTLRERGASLPEKKAFPPRVLSYGDLLEKVRSRTERFDDVLESFLKTLPDSMDERDLCIETASFLLDLSGEKGPLILVGFLPPFYPPRLNRSESAGERALLRAVERLKEAGKPYGLSISRIDVFQGIMDLSYLGFQGAPSELDALAENMPLWGRGYRFPLNELKKLDVPIANFGPIGKDDHKNAERIHLPYYLHTLPPLFFKFVEFLAEES
ncbi:MAG TPA: M20/M25/M40 family metallo-hydrolase [Aminobacteriaceae bacterium]|nr:M20/M25/M40 family metallo-hydrolase [Aminobacteriaceae bacterium]